MATTNFDLTSGTAAVWGGLYTDGSAGGHDFRSSSGPSVEVQVTITGTDAVLNCQPGIASPITVTVDGVTTTPVFGGGVLSTWTTLSLFTGLADGPHTVKIKLIALTANLGKFFYERGTNSKTVMVTGAAPAVSVASPFSATRQVYVPSSDTTNFRQEGEWTTTAGTGSMTFIQNGFAAHTYAGGALRFSAKTDSIMVWGFSQATVLRLKVDGLPTAPVTVGTVGALDFQWWPAFSGLDATAYHTYELIVDANAPTGTSGGSTLQIYQLLLQNGTGVNPTPLAARNLFAGYGDSISSPGYFPTLYASRETWCHAYLMAANRGLGYVGCGIPSTTVSSTFSGAASGQSRTSDLTRLGSAVTACVVHYGINDVHFGVSTATFQAAYTAMMQALVTGLPSTLFYCLGVLPQNPVTFTLSASQIATQNAAIVAAIAAVSPNANILYIDPTNWPLNPPSGAGAWSYFSDGGVHPNGAGYGAIANLIESALGGAAPAGRKRPRLIGVS